MANSNHQLPSGSNVVYNLVVRKFANGSQTDSIFVQSPAVLPIPSVGDYLETKDNVDGISVAGTVKRIFHRNGVVSGPSYTSLVEVHVE